MRMIKITVTLVLSISLILLTIFNIAYGEMPDYRKLSAACGQDNDPPWPRPEDCNGHQSGGPPQEAYLACRDKVSGNESRFVTPWGETITGVCRERDGVRFLVPYRFSDIGMIDLLYPPPECGCGPFSIIPDCESPLFYPPFPPDWMDEWIDNWMDDDLMLAPF